MPKDKLNDYSATNASNTDVGGVNVDEGMLPSAVNNALRELMTHLKDFADGTEAVNAISVDNLKLDGNTISSTDTNGNIVISPNGTGEVDITGTVAATSYTGDGSALTGTGGTRWQSTIVTGTTLSAVSGNGYWIDTTSNQCTITFPSSASVGDTIELVDYARTWNANKIIINPNGLNYKGSTSNVEYTKVGQALRAVYSGATEGWTPVSVDGDNADASLYDIDFLVIAGGGGGGTTAGAGGGAGGYRNSYNSETSGGNSTSESSFKIGAVGTQYTITVGAGGSGGTFDGANGANGSNSVFSNITSTGGGGGSHGGTGATGGSGGGGGYGAGVGGAGTTGQGSSGGNGNTDGSPAPHYPCGGGGGAGAVGGNAVSATNVGGAGGNGLASSITASSVTRAGGGGGSGVGNASGGSGGGGQGGPVGSSTRTNGTSNTGGGGGGGGGFSLGNGGSGVVILRMSTANYSGNTTGSPSVTTSGSDTILTYTGSGSYTA